tara:strand:- start:809 stop:1765 length:957 start_codon:yes stop_codon:yes gene_type:complete
MFIASKTAFNVYSKFNTLRKYPEIASLFPTKLHAYYDQTERRLTRFGCLMNSDDNTEKVRTSGVQDIIRLKNDWNAAWISYLLQLDDWLLKGDLHHIIFRKLALQRATHARLMNAHATIKQLVILGSGLDHLGWLFSDKCPSFELDIKPMISYKMKLSPILKQKVHFIDFNAMNDSLEQCLTLHSAFNSSEACLFITEGFIDYIPKKNLESLVSQIKRIHPENEWISTHFDRSLLNSKQRFFFELGVQITGEQLQANLTKEQIISIGYNNGFVLEHEWASIPELLDEQTIPIKSKLNTIEKKVLNRKNMNGCTVMHFK